MSKLQVFEYNQHKITFDFGDGNRMINATEMAKVFNKKVNNFLRQKSTENYIKALTEHLMKKKNKSETLISVSLQEQIIRVVKGNFSNGHAQGTWMHRTLALRFAQWLDPKFAIWVDEKIQELLHQGYTSIHPPKNITYIYFIKSVELNRVKIGMSKSVYQRFVDLRIASSDELEILKIVRVNATYPTDRAIHVLFPHLWIHGEWFQLTTELQAFIDGLETLSTQKDLLKYERQIAELTAQIAVQKQKLFRKNRLIESLTKELGQIQKDYQQLKNTFSLTKTLPSRSNEAIKTTSLSDIYFDKIYLPKEGEWLQIDLQDILYFKVDGREALLFTSNGESHTIPLSFQNLLAELGGKYFVEIHRGCALNLKHLKAIRLKKNKAVLSGNVTLPISRRMLENLVERIKVLK
ncbi:MAG: KilA-N domain-containing protein [Chitinophagales bacterium]